MTVPPNESNASAEHAAPIHTPVIDPALLQPTPDSDVAIPRATSEALGSNMPNNATAPSHGVEAGNTGQAAGTPAPGDAPADPTFPTSSLDAPEFNMQDFLAFDDERTAGVVTDIWWTNEIYKKCREVSFDCHCIRVLADRYVTAGGRLLSTLRREVGENR